ncbi:MAG TPA: discoidin domain-containing protein, partial [Actinopolymorphaceae bacterium]|nr:discoidin domain-containing protein [Actinopolymorphaceae bacterium]
KALVAYNSGTQRKAFQVQWGDRWFGYALDPGSAVTFTWQGDQHGAGDSATIGSVDLAFSGPGSARPVVSYDAGLVAFLDQVRVGDSWIGYSIPTGGSFAPPGTPTALDRSGWTVSASASSPDDPVGNAIDGDPTTRWSTGHGMEPGDFFQVDLGATKAFSEVDIDTSGSPGDFVRGYEIYVSDDGTTWGQPIAKGGGRTDLHVLVPPVQARYVKIVNTGSSGSWWSIHELNVLAPQAGAASGSTGTSAGAMAAGATAAGATGAGVDLASAQGDLQRKTATLSDGTELEVIYNAGHSVATFEVDLAGTPYTYTLPAGATASFTKKAG